MAKFSQRTASSKLLENPKHAILFFLFFLAGTAVLTFAKFLILPSVVVVVVAFALMVGYGVFVTVIPATKLRLDIAADNLYYLGFLYTLSSLAIALTIDDVEKILSNFGVAIASTLIGIAARVSLNQLRVDPNDIEEASRTELSEATRRVRRELDATILQLSSFRNLSMQAMTEGFEDIQNKVDQISTNLLSSIETTVEKANATLEKSSATLLSSVESTVDKSSASIERLVSMSTEATNEMLNNVGAVVESSEDIIAANKKMSKQTNALTETLASLETHYSNTEFLDDKVITALTAQLDDIKENFLKTIRSIDKDANKGTRQARRKVKDTNAEAGTDRENQQAVQILQNSSDGETTKYTMYKDKIIHFNNSGDSFTTADKKFKTIKEAKKHIDDQGSFFRRFIGGD